VTDTGIGIRKEDMSKLFEPFTRLDSPIKIKVSGTGLGLYLARKLAREVLRGDIRFESEYGKGSKFIMEVPL
jgi:signal transduction histidine kinase